MDAALRNRGLEIELRPLLVGDYDLGPALVERKRVRDLHLAIIERRFWRQIGRLRETAYFVYLLVEGLDLDAGPLRPESIRGALLAAEELGVRVIRSTDPDDSAFWLSILVSRVQRRRANAPRREPRTSGHARGPAAALAGVPGISATYASALLDHFGSVAGIIAAGREEWLKIPGIGPVRATALEQTLCTARAFSPSPHPGEGRDPST